jgi:hypothetical protein
MTTWLERYAILATVYYQHQRVFAGQEVGGVDLPASAGLDTIDILSRDENREIENATTCVWREGRERDKRLEKESIVILRQAFPKWL